MSTRLTCPRCERDLYPDVARLDGDTYVHAGRCPCRIDDCEQPLHARGYCDKHYYRLIKFGDPLANVNRNLVIEIEDVEWMVETGENLTGAAARLGVKNADSLDAWLRRKGRVDLAVALTSRNPRDWNRANDGNGLTRAALRGASERAKEARHNDRKKQKRREQVAA